MQKVASVICGCLFTMLAPCSFLYSQQLVIPEEKQPLCCQRNQPSRFLAKHLPIAATSFVQASNRLREGMVWIEGGTFTMGSSTEEGRSDEFPRHQVKVDGFWMEATEVTNAQFQQFVQATGYITTAEKAPDWNELQKQLPSGTPKPDDSLLVAASLVFMPLTQPVTLNDASKWWSWTKGANWRHPEGAGSTIKGKEDYPVVHVSWDDANAYAKWAGKRLPTEAEWEYAARGGLVDQPFTWGSEAVDSGKAKANIWQGHFPDFNTGEDGFKGLAPVKRFAPNGYGLYDMAGNVWEWCSDWYRPDYFVQFQGSIALNPKGPSSGYDPDEPTIAKRVLRGGSFLCHASYCSSYRVSARMRIAPDTGLQHTGFRCVADP
jgi:formylglycine-generating enzyme